MMFVAEEMAAATAVATLDRHQHQDKEQQIPGFTARHAHAPPKN
jgi:hypothetical protein